MGKRLDLIGQKFGRLTVLEDAGNNKRGNSLWKCQCECENIKIINSTSLITGKSKSCGCLKNENRLDLTNQRFGKLVAIKRVWKDRQGNYLWYCECDCGGNIITRGSGLKCNDIKSCGCTRGLNNRKEKGESGFNSLLERYKRNGAKKRNLEFDLTKDQFKQLTKQNCYYCGEIPLMVTDSGGHTTKEGKGWGKYIYNGVDRTDSSKGYTIKNCVPCCGICNRMKSNMTINDFLDHISKIKDNRNCKILAEIYY